MRRALLGFFSALSLLWGLSGTAAEPATTARLAGPSWEGLLEAEGKGLYWELLHKVYDGEGIRVEHQIMPWSRARQRLLSGEAELLLGEYRPAGRSQELVFANWPVDSDEVTVVYRKDEKTAWAEEQTFEGRKVSWVRGYNMAARLPVKVELYEANDLQAALKLLQGGRVDFVLDYDWDIKEALAALKLPPEAFEQRKLQRVEPLYAAFAKNAAGERLAAIWDRRMQALYESGELDALYQRYEYPRYPK